MFTREQILTREITGTIYEIQGEGWHIEETDSGGGPRVHQIVEMPDEFKKHGAKVTCNASFETSQKVRHGIVALDNCSATIKDEYFD